MTDLLTGGDAAPRIDPPAPAAPALLTVRGPVRRLRINALDRPWAGHWTGVVVTPIRMPARADVRAAWQRLLEQTPENPLACRIDDRTGAWLSVAAEDRPAHLDRTIVAIEDPAVDEADAFLARSLQRLAPDQSILIGVGEQTLLLLWTHQIGDGATTTTFIKALLDLDEPALAALANRARLSTVARALPRQAWVHGREWWAMARRRTGGATEEHPDGVTRLPAALAGDPTQVVSVRWSSADLQLVSRWRSRHAKGTSITAVLTAATHRALVDAGLPMDRTGFHSLVDLRRYLPDGGFVPGNLAKSVRIEASLTDLTAISGASKEAVDTARPVASTVIGSVAGAAAGRLRRHRPAPAHPAPVNGPVAMTFNSMPALPGLSELPWLPGGVRQYVGVGYPAGAGSLTVFAMRMREHMQVTVTFPASMMDADRMRDLMRSIPGRIDRLIGG